MFYRFAWHLCHFFCFLTGRIEYYQKNNLLKEAPFLLVSNHRSNLDPFLVGLGMRREVAFLAKDSLFDNPILNFLLLKVNARPVKRDGDPRAAINEMVDFLGEGKPITLFPEGKRNKTDRPLLPFKQGAALIAIKAQIPVIPVAVRGSQNFFGKKQIVYGEPIMPPKTAGKAQREALTQELESSIAFMLEQLAYYASKEETKAHN